MNLDYSTAKDGSLSSEDFSTILYNSYNGICLETTSEDIPLPWDAVISIEGLNAIIQGGVGPCGFGNVEIKIPKNRMKEFYKAYIEPLPGKEQLIEDTLKKYDIEVIV